MHMMSCAISFLATIVHCPKLSFELSTVSFLSMATSNQDTQETTQNTNNTQSRQLIVHTVAGPGTGPAVPVPCKYYLEGFCVHGEA